MYALIAISVAELDLSYNLRTTRARSVPVSECNNSLPLLGCPEMVLFTENIYALIAISLADVDLSHNLST